MNVTLVGFAPDGSRREFRVKGGRFLIGRKPECDLCIPHATVSRQHAEIVVDGEEARVRDLGSSNGTFLNDVRVQESGLQAGDRVTIGPAALVIQIDGVPANIVPDAIPDASDDSGPDGTSQSDAMPDDDEPVASKASAGDDDEDDSDDPLGKLISRQKDDESSIFDFDFGEDEEDDMR